MSEAIVLAILVPIAGALSGLIIKFWELIANKRKHHHDEQLSYRDELRKDLERKNKEIEQLRQELREAKDNKDNSQDKWRLWYYELFSMFYALRLVTRALNKDNEVDNILYGIAPHEREDK